MAARPRVVAALAAQLRDLDAAEEAFANAAAACLALAEPPRDVAAWLKCEFMQDHVGSSFGGVISAVTGFGFFVRLNDLFIDGLVHITALPSDYYQFDPQRQMLIGENFRRRFRLGDALQVKVASVTLETRQIELVLAYSDAHQPSRGAAQPQGDGARREPWNATAKAAAGRSTKGGGRSGTAAKPPAAAGGKGAAGGKKAGSGGSQPFAFSKKPKAASTKTSGARSKKKKQP